MKAIRVLTAVLALAGLCAAQEGRGQAKPKDEFQAVTTRATFYRLFGEVQSALAARGPVADAKEFERINREYDAAIFLYLQGRKELDVVKLKTLIDSVLVPPPSPAEVAARCLQVELDPPVYILSKPVKPTAHVTTMVPLTWTGDKPLELKLRARPASGAALESAAFTIAPSAEPVLVDVKVDLPAPGEGSACGVWTVELAGPFERTIEVASWPVVPRSLDAVRTENEAKLAALKTDNTFLQEAQRTFAARNALLTDQPSPKRPREFLLDPCRRMAELDVEIQALAAGKDAYKRLKGDNWRVIRLTEKKQMPVRIFAPEAAAKGDYVPLVIALHAQGMDENYFFEVSGGGKLPIAAEGMGFLLAVPGIDFKFEVSEFDALVNALGDDYQIDPKRIYVLGHSVGGAQAAEIARLRGDRVAAMGGIGGGDLSSGGKPSPGLIMAGGVDPIQTVEQLQKKTQKAQERFGGVGIAFQTIDHYGCYLMLEPGIEILMPWLLEHKLE